MSDEIKLVIDPVGKTIEQIMKETIIEAEKIGIRDLVPSTTAKRKYKKKYEVSSKVHIEDLIFNIT